MPSWICSQHAPSWTSVLVLSLCTILTWKDLYWWLINDSAIFWSSSTLDSMSPREPDMEMRRLGSQIRKNQIQAQSQTSVETFKKRIKFEKKTNMFLLYNMYKTLIIVKLLPHPLQIPLLQWIWQNFAGFISSLNFDYLFLTYLILS